MMSGLGGGVLSTRTGWTDWPSLMELYFQNLTHLWVFFTVLYGDTIIQLF